MIPAVLLGLRVVSGAFLALGAADVVSWWRNAFGGSGSQSSSQPSGYGGWLVLIALALIGFELHKQNRRGRY